MLFLIITYSTEEKMTCLSVTSKNIRKKVMSKKRKESREEVDTIYN
jgi:hypothetical protein